MGYTHYFNFKEDIKTFSENVLKDINRISNDYKSIIRYESDSVEKPLITTTEIHLNGIEDDGYETFILTSNAIDFNFCKTAEKPYDLPVCEILLILKHYYKDNFDLRSDGFSISKQDFENKKLDANWNLALDNVKEKFGYTFELIPETSQSNGRTYYKLSIE